MALSESLPPPAMWSVVLTVSLLGLGVFCVLASMTAPKGMQNGLMFGSLVFVTLAVAGMLVMVATSVWFVPVIVLAFFAAPLAAGHLLRKIHDRRQV